VPVPVAKTTIAFCALLCVQITIVFRSFAKRRRKMDRFEVKLNRELLPASKGERAMRLGGYFAL
jgi:hypothetical protein